MARAGKQEFAIIGLGRFGASLALALTEMGHTVLAIDHDPALARRAPAAPVGYPEEQILIG